MPTIQELGELALASYDDPPKTTLGWTKTDFHRAASATDGFQAATFSKGAMTVIAYRGTTQLMDVAIDAQLGLGFNTDYYAQAEDFAKKYFNKPNVYVCGHSLGGAIAQIVANRHGFKFATFNAPGVAAVASRNVASSTKVGMAIRLSGMAWSAALHPVQAMSDIRAAFRVVHGLNVCLENDVVSKIGIHYGAVTRIPGTSNNPANEHRMVTVNSVLRHHAVGKVDIAAA